MQIVCAASLPGGLPGHPQPTQLFLCTPRGSGADVGLWCKPRGRGRTSDVGMLRAPVPDLQSACQGAFTHIGRILCGYSMDGFYVGHAPTGTRNPAAVFLVSFFFQFFSGSSYWPLSVSRGRVSESSALSSAISSAPSRGGRRCRRHLVGCKKSSCGWRCRVPQTARHPRFAF